MTLKIFSIRDSKGECYQQPFFRKMHGEAERDFKTLINKGDNQVSMYPEDYDLYYLGEFNERTGCSKLLDTPQHVAKAISLLKRPTDPSDLSTAARA